MHRTIPATLLILALCSSLPSPPAARAEEQPVELGVQAAQAWLKLVDSGDYSASWETAAALFRQAVPEEQWVQTITKVRRPLGKRVFRKLVLAKYETQLPGAPEGKYVVIQFKTLFNNGAEALETITPMLDPDGQWRVSGYYIK